MPLTDQFTKSVEQWAGRKLDAATVKDVLWTLAADRELLIALFDSHADYAVDGIGERCREDGGRHESECEDYFKELMSELWELAGSKTA